MAIFIATYICQFLFVLFTGGKHPLAEPSNWIMQILSWLTFAGYAYVCITAWIAGITGDKKHAWHTCIWVIIANVTIGIAVKLFLAFGIFIGLIVFLISLVLLAFLG